MPAGELSRPPFLMANGLKWMRAEIDAALHRVRLLLDQHQEAPQEGDALLDALALLEHHAEVVLRRGVASCARSCPGRSWSSGGCGSVEVPGGLLGLLFMWL
jgi:hypothetical protein